MQTKLAEITPADVLAARDFLIGLTDEFRIAPRPATSGRKPHGTRPAVPVSNGIGRARCRSAKAAG